MILHSTILENGLRVYVHTMPGVRTVTFSVWVDQGSKDEGPESNGLSHLTEHIAFDIGTDGGDNHELWASLQRVGARCNATTTKEFTYYLVTLVPEHATLACRALRSMVDRTVGARSLDRERMVVLEEYGIHMSSTDQIYDRLAQSLWGDSTIGQMVLGRREVIENVTLEEIRRFIAAGYRADRAGLVVVGDIDHQQVFDLAEKYFGDWTDSLDCRPQPELSTENSIVVIPTATDQVTLALGMSAYAYNDPRRHHVELMAKILGSGVNARLSAAIRLNRGLAYYVAAYSQSFAPGGLLAAIVKCNRQNVSEVIKLALQEFARMRTELVPEEELSMAKELLRTDKYIEVENTANRLRLIGRAAMLGESFSLNSYLRLIRTITSEQLRETACDIFRQWNLAAAVIGNVNEDNLLEDISRAV